MLNSNRPLQISAFLDRHGWNEATAHSFTGDFSPRRYARLSRPDGATIIMMDADADQKTVHFVALAKMLRTCQINAPEIFAAAPQDGLVLMQDFGTQNIGVLLDKGDEAEPFLSQATAILARLHDHFDEKLSTIDLPSMNHHYFVPQAELFLDFYLPLIKNITVSDSARSAFHQAWHEALLPLDVLPKSLILRDYIPDNLMKCADGSIGVLDFQDAGIGCIAYDLASLCDEVRRDGAFKHLGHMIDRYLTQRTNKVSLPSPETMAEACIILSAQRHTRTLGNVTRIALRGGQRERLSYLPRMEKHFHILLGHDALTPVRGWMERNIP